MTRPTLPPDAFDGRPAAVRAYVRPLEARLADLEARVGRNAANAAKPPSSDGPRVDPAPPQSPSGPRRGGQPGHPTHGRGILPPDEVRDRPPTHGRSCRAPVAGDGPRPIVHRVVERPAQRRHVPHRRRHPLTRARRAALTTAPAVPAAASGFGPRLTAAPAHLGGVGRLGKRAIRTPFADRCGIPVSLAAVGELAAAVRRPLDPIRAAADARAQGLDAGVDETGWKQGKDEAWPWVAVANLRAASPIRPNRNRRAFDDLAGPTPGVPTTDRFPV